MIFSFCLFLFRKKEAKAWQERVWELQQITYLMDTLVPAREFYRTRAGIGASSEASIRYYEKPNTTPPPIQATKDLLWCLHREICTSRTLQAVDNWHYLRSRMLIYHQSLRLKEDAENESIKEQIQEDEEQWCEMEKELKHELKNEEKEESKTPNQKKNSSLPSSKQILNVVQKWVKVAESNGRVWDQRRLMFRCQRKRRWEQCLDSLINLSNYSNSKKHETSTLTSIVSDGSNSPRFAPSLLANRTSATGVVAATATAAQLELLKSMVPFLPSDLRSFGADKTAKLLFEIASMIGGTNRGGTNSDGANSGGVNSGTAATKNGNLSDKPRAARPESHDRKSYHQQQYATSTNERIQSTPFLARKESEWWNSKKHLQINSKNRKNGTGGVASPRRNIRSPRVPRGTPQLMQSPRIMRDCKRSLELENKFVATRKSFSPSSRTLKRRTSPGKKK